MLRLEGSLWSCTQVGSLVDRRKVGQRSSGGEESNLLRVQPVNTRQQTTLTRSEEIPLLLPPPPVRAEPMQSNAVEPPFPRPDLTGKVALVSGATRGIGKSCCMELAKCGASVVVTGKTTVPHPSLPGTIYSVAAEIEQETGTQVLAVPLDVRDLASVKRCVSAAVDKFGRLDIVIANASALWWHSILDTPASRFQLIHEVNVHGTFYLIQEALPHLVKAGGGHVITMSPPISANAGGPRAVAGMASYLSSKIGMTLMALGVAGEHKKDSISGCSLWPATVVESAAAVNHALGDQSGWRRPEILSHAVLLILAQNPRQLTGRTFIDEEVFVELAGFSDFARYRNNPNVEPPKMASMGNQLGQRGKPVRGAVQKGKQSML